MSCSVRPHQQAQSKGCKGLSVKMQVAHDHRSFEAAGTTAHRGRRSVQADSQVVAHPQVEPHLPSTKRRQTAESDLAEMNHRYDEGFLERHANRVHWVVTRPHSWRMETSGRYSGFS